MFDLNTLIAKETAVVAVRHPLKKEPTGMTLTIAGPAADAYQRERRRTAKARFDAGAVTIEGIEGAALDLLVACVTAWSGFQINGEELPCTPENVRKVLSIPGLYWLKDFIDTEVANLGNFLTI